MTYVILVAWLSGIYLALGLTLWAHRHRTAPQYIGQLLHPLWVYVFVWPWLLVNWDGSRYLERKKYHYQVVAVGLFEPKVIYDIVTSLQQLRGEKNEALVAHVMDALPDGTTDIYLQRLVGGRWQRIDLVRGLYDVLRT